MSYSVDERLQAVRKLVQGGLAFTKDRLGPRDVKSAYAQLSELVNSALFYEPDSVFYLIYLSSNFYTRTVNAQIVLLEELLDAVDDLAKPDKPINDIAPLNTARQALLGMDNALGRSGAVGDREYQRYSKSIDDAKRNIGAATKYAYVPRGASQVATDVVRPKSEARTIVSQRFASINAAHSGVLDSVDLLLSAYEQFMGLPLSAKIAQRQILRAADELSNVHSELAALSPKNRTKKARDGLLAVLSNKAAVKALANRVIPGSAKVLQEAGAPEEYRLKAYGSGTAPYVQGARSGPWDLQPSSGDDPSHNLSFTINGVALSTIDLKLNSGGYVRGASKAEVVSGKRGPFAISADVAIPNPLRTRDIVSGGDYAVQDKVLYLNVDGNQLQVSFSTADNNAIEVASYINSAIGGYVDASAISDGGNQYVKIEWNNTTSPPARYSNRYMEVTTGVDNADDFATWKVIHDATETEATLTRGWDANNELKLQVGDSQSVVTETLTSGAWPNYSRTADEIQSEIGGTGYDAEETSDGAIRIFTTGVGSKAFLVVRTDGLRDSGGRSGFGEPSHLCSETLGFSNGQESRRSGVNARAVANVLNGDADFEEQATAVVVKDVLLKANNVIYATSTSIEVVLRQHTEDPSENWEYSEVRLDIHGGDNRGTYLVDSTSWSSSTKTLTITIDERTFRDSTAENRHQVTIYREFLKIVSKDESTSGSVQVNSVTDSAHELIGLPTAGAISSVLEVLIERNDDILGWVPADLRRRYIKVGDKILDSLGTEAASVSGISNISSGRLSVTAVQSDLDLSSGFSVVSAAYLAYQAFESALSDWLLNDASPFDENLSSIDRALNYVLNVSSPSKNQVDNAYDSVSSLKNKMESLKTVLSSFSVSSVSVMDKALDSLLQHGHDRARELLLQSKIEEYFGTSERDASYSRALMAAASSVTVEDLNETTNMGEDIDEFDRYAGGWMDEYDPAMQFEDEDELPEGSLVNFWPDLVS